ncbi:hypothetical protein M427DRAFT_286615 [Gonapodya prolifera JEL478]|uniref:Uncharacterized protein n=1 Tax=Gonapodya prolifera (strain JEL478) TaxID=1344416 RepID=A0A139AKB3_GONPJ|nr:hypothetical protein M427DRAFT_286615 [Gonapodya prolifera JEL478]|eukprot:KXS16865.1 hypothetical protein M427DRAFT_286615 [Gonapodya prolifera JEL478]
MRPNHTMEAAGASPRVRRAQLKSCTYPLFACECKVLPLPRKAPSQTPHLQCGVVLPYLLVQSCEVTVQEDQASLSDHHLRLPQYRLAPLATLFPRRAQLRDHQHHRQLAFTLSTFGTIRVALFASLVLGNNAIDLTVLIDKEWIRPRHCRMTLCSKDPMSGVLSPPWTLFLNSHERSCCHFYSY